MAIRLDTQRILMEPVSSALRRKCILREVPSILRIYRAYSDGSRNGTCEEERLCQFPGGRRHSGSFLLLIFTRRHSGAVLCPAAPLHMPHATDIILYGATRNSTPHISNIHWVGGMRSKCGCFLSSSYGSRSSSHTHTHRPLWISMPHTAALFGQRETETQSAFASAPKPSKCVCLPCLMVKTVHECNVRPTLLFSGCHRSSSSFVLSSSHGYTLLILQNPRIVSLAFFFPHGVTYFRSAL